MPKKILLCLIVVSAVVLVSRQNVETLLLPPDARLPDGGRYYGEIENGLFSGEGKIVYDNGASYHGHFKDGLFSGLGTLVTQRGDRYQGEFSEGALTGQGEIETVDGRHYQGQLDRNTPHGFGRWDYAKDYYYIGELAQGRYHGHGTLADANGDRYTGEFKAGQYEGEGEFVYASGDKYIGQFKAGRLHGPGRYITAEGQSYEGQFEDDQFGKQGVYEDKQGNRYEGEFEDWYYHGQGTLRTAKGDSYEGGFEYGQYHGQGVYKGKDGQSYHGQFEYGQYQGEGRLQQVNGDQYEGEFQYGRFHGKGVLTFAAPKDGKISQAGYWRQHRYIGEKAGFDQQQYNVEQALYLQEDLIEQALATIKPSDPERINLYFVGVGGDGKQNVFYNEVRVIREVFDTRFDTAGRSLIIANNQDTVSTIPMATTTAIERLLNGVAEKMDGDNDVLFFYLTSHGSDKHELVISQQGMKLPNLSAKRLGEIIKALPVKWKVLVVSACYSGGAIPELADPHHLVMTAADLDRQSFGCSDDADMTYFGRAYFLDAIPESDSFIAAFDKAKTLIIEREKEVIEGDEDKHSRPQISKPGAISDYLKQWRRQLGDLAQAQTMATEVQASHNRQAPAIHAVD